MSVDHSREMDSLEQQGIAALKNNEFDTAANIYRELLLRDYKNSIFWNNLSLALRGSGHWASALICAKRALELDQSNLNRFVNLGNIYVDLDRINEAVDSYAIAVNRAPDNGLYRERYAAALRAMGNLGESLRQINIACELQPDNIESRYQRAVTHLMEGALSSGWKDFELRWERGTLKRGNYRTPEWRGQDLKGKTILLYQEQGMGDTILTSRYISLVKEQGARVIVSCNASLHSLFQTIPGVDLFADGGAFTLDYHAPMMSLSGIFKTTLDTIPPSAQLYPTENLSADISKLLMLGKDHFKVGIVWSGSAEFKDNHRRSAPFTRFLTLAEIPGVQLYSLQKGAQENELKVAGAEGLVLELGSHLNNFADTAAVIKKLDLIIMTDSAVAHLAGSLGKPIWNLLNFSSFWLYLTDRDNSPWYPSMRLFRQPSPGDWDSVFKEVSIELAKTVALKK